jgi:dsRNA-specific ribonuclease
MNWVHEASAPSSPPELRFQQKDPTMELNEHCQRIGIFAGPDYQETQLAEQLFQCSVTVAGGPAATGQAAPSKKEAKKYAAAQWLVHNYSPQSTEQMSSQSSNNSVAELNELCQANSHGLPQYQIIQLAEQLFQCSVTVAGGQATTGQAAPSKKEAKKYAAAQWLAQHHSPQISPGSSSDSVAELNELCQANSYSAPQYKLTQLAEQLFQCSVSVELGDAVLGQPASSKMAAKKNAATEWLAQHWAAAR